MQKYVKKKRKNHCYKYRELFYKDCCLDTRYTRPFSCKLVFTPCCFRFEMKFLELFIATQETNFNDGSDKFGQKKPRCPEFSIHSIMCLKDNGQELLKVAPVFPFGLL